jgi:hypothetical protein
MSALSGRLFAVLVGVALVVPTAQAADVVAADGKFAFLAACDSYDPKELRPFPHTREDLTRLQGALRGLGFKDVNVIRMDGRQADRRYQPNGMQLRQELKRFLENLEAEDSVVVALAGHAVQFTNDERAYFCPLDARLNDRASLLRLEEVYQLLAKCRAQRKLLLLDVCRRNPQAEASGRPALEAIARPQRAAAPPGVMVLFGSEEGKEGLDVPSLPGSLFFHHVVDGLRGAATPTGRVSPDDLARYVVTETSAYARQELKAEQTPVRMGATAAGWLLRDGPARSDIGKVRVEPVQPAESRYRLEVRVRRPGAKDAGRNLAIEVARDPTSGALLYLSETGDLAAASATTPRGQPKSAQAPWRHGLTVRVRRAGEPDETEDTARHRVEVYRDTAAGNLVYVADFGGVAVVPFHLETGTSTGSTTAVKWQQVLELEARKAGERDLSLKCGMEIYEDLKNNNLLFISTDRGCLAALKPGDVNLPGKREFCYALEVPVRKVGAAQATRTLGVEVYRDSASNSLIYLTEEGKFAVTRPRPGAPVGRPANPRPVATLLRGLDLQTAGTKPRKVVVEIVRDENGGQMLCVTQDGAIAILPDAKK